MSPASGIAPDAPLEFRLLLGLLSPRGGGAETRELLARPPDWERVVRLAGRHKVLPHVYRALREGFRDSAPAEALQRLEDEAGANARRNLMLTGRLLKLLTLLAAAGVEAVPFKGPLLALSAYGDSSMRQFADLDLLVRPADVPRAR